MNAHLHNTDHLIKAKWQAGSPILISGAVTKSSLGEEGDDFQLTIQKSEQELRAASHMTSTIRNQETQMLAGSLLCSPVVSSVSPLV